VPVVTIVHVAAHALVCRGPRLGAALALHVDVSMAQHSDHAFPWRLRRACPELRSEGNRSGLLIM